MIEPGNIYNECPLCGNTELRKLFGSEHFLTKCRNCKTVFSKLIPSESEIKIFYDDYPSHNEISPITINRYNDILDKLEYYRKTNNLLETGCGHGLFLEEARKRNWNIFGTEISASAIEECRKKNIPVSESIDEMKKLSGGLFDAVVSIEVLEHLVNPAKEIESYNNILISGGVVYLTTPNFNSLSRKILGSKWNVIAYPEHLFYFTSQTSKKLMNDRGFRQISKQTTGFSPARLLYTLRSVHKDKAIEFDYNGRDRKMMVSIEKSTHLTRIKNMLNGILSLFNLGDTLKILYQKT